jgi:GDP-L-fucose synthase
MCRQETASFLRDKRVWVTSHSGLIGSAVVRRLWREQCEIVLAAPSQLDLLRQDEVEAWFRRQRPDVIFLTERAPERGALDAAAPASALYRPLLAEINVLAAACNSGAATLVSIAETGTAFSSAPGEGEVSPVPGDAGLESSPARLALIRLTQGYTREYGCRFMVLLASCVYGPDKAGTADAPQLLRNLFRRFAEAVRRGEPTVELEGGDVLPHGFIHTDDLADAAVYLSRSYDGQEPLHCRLRDDASLREAAEMVAELAGYSGRIVLNTQLRCERPLSTTGISSLGWQPSVSFQQRIRELHDAWLCSEAG